MGIVEQLAEIRAARATENASRLFVENLLKDSDFTEAKIASLANVPANVPANVSLSFVRKVKKGLATK